jgi:hypothetical protein
MRQLPRVWLGDRICVCAQSEDDAGALAKPLSDDLPALRECFFTDEVRLWPNADRAR